MCIYRLQITDYRPSTKEAASMPPWQPLSAGLFLQSTYPSHLLACCSSTSYNYSTYSTRLM